MRLGYMTAVLSSLTIVFWRVVVIAMNSCWAVSRNRWVDASYWLAEDPLERLEIFMNRIVISGLVGPQLKLYLVEATGVLVWSAIAYGVYRVLAATAVVRRLNRVTIGWKTALVAIVIAAVGSYLGGLFRQHIVGSFHVQLPWAIETIAMLLTVVVAGSGPIVLIAWLVYRRAVVSTVTRN